MLLLRNSEWPVHGLANDVLGLLTFHCQPTVTLHSPPVRLGVAGSLLIIRLQGSASVEGCPLVAVLLGLHQGPTIVAALAGGEVVIALALSLEPQLVSVVLNV